MPTEQAVTKLKISEPLPTATENYQYLEEKRKQEQVSSFEEFLRWFDKKDVVPAPKAKQKIDCFLP